MPLKRQFTRCMLRPEEVTPTSERTRVVGAFNPGVAELDGKVVLLVRVVEEPIATRDGFVVSPNFGEGGTLTLDYLQAAEHDLTDPRKYIHRRTGITRLRFYSYLKVFTSSDGQTIDGEGASVFPQGKYEEYGIEDPRVTRIGDTYYITYVGVSRHGVNSCLMSTRDFVTFQRHGIVFVTENKDTILFPEKVRDHYVAMHRPVSHMQFTPPEMWIAWSPDLVHWGRHEQLLGAELAWQNSRIGGGTPPLRTEEGWLTMYHGSQTLPDEPVGKYRAGLLLLDAERPALIRACSPEPVAEPEADFELGGYVANVVFPTGWVDRGDELYVYYGAADSVTGVMGLRRDDLMRTLAKK